MGEAPKKPVSVILVLLNQSNLNSFLLVKHTTILITYNHHPLIATGYIYQNTVLYWALWMEILQRVEKNVLLLLLSSQSKKECIGNLQSTTRKTCIVARNHLELHRSPWHFYHSLEELSSIPIYQHLKPRAQRNLQLSLRHIHVVENVYSLASLTLWHLWRWRMALKPHKQDSRSRCPAMTQRCNYASEARRPTQWQTLKSKGKKKMTKATAVF